MSNKYHARRTQVDGIWFDSQAEARRYGELKLAQECGSIYGLECHPHYPLVVNGQKIAVYVGDFLYTERDGRRVVEDVKSAPTRTASYRIKAKLLKALYDIDIVEVTA